LKFNFSVFYYYSVPFAEKLCTTNHFAFGHNYRLPLFLSNPSALPTFLLDKISVVTKHQPQAMLDFLRVDSVKQQTKEQKLLSSLLAIGLQV